MLSLPTRCQKFRISQTQFARKLTFYLKVSNIKILQEDFGKTCYLFQVAGIKKGKYHKRIYFAAKNMF